MFLTDLIPTDLNTQIHAVAIAAYAAEQKISVADARRQCIDNKDAEKEIGIIYHKIIFVITGEYDGRPFEALDEIHGVLGNWLWADTLTTKELAEESGVTEGRIRQLAAQIPGAIKKDRHWRFPVNAVDFVKSQPSPGPKPKKKYLQGR